MPRLVMVCGPNGSGKSSLIQALRAQPGLQLPAEYINADDWQRATGVDAAAAQAAATAQRRVAVAAGRDLMYETVMSHPSKLAELQDARSAGYEIDLHAVATEHADINVRRVALRVAAGGHDVPEDRIRQRHQRCLRLLPAALALADRAAVFDNSQDGRLRLQAAWSGHRLLPTDSDPAGWVRRLGEQLLERHAEWQRLLRLAGRRSLTAPRLTGDASLGPIELAGAHFITQWDPQRRQLLAHDRLLLPDEALFAPGTRWRIAYQDGVGQAQPSADIGPVPGR